MKRSSPLLGLLIFFSLASFLLAEEDPCAGVGGARDTIECAEPKLKEAEAGLDRAFSESLKRIYASPLTMSNQQRASLKENLAHAHDSWLNWRNDECEFEGESGFGAGAWPNAHTLLCKIKLTQQRTAYYDSVFK